MSDVVPENRRVTTRLKRREKIRLLVSVRNAAEAEAALAGGADWIDLKEPQRGALGAVDPSVAREVVDCVAGRAPISAAAGELAEWQQGGGRRLLQIDGLAVLKLGLAGYRGRPWRQPWHAARGTIVSAGKQLAAVIYADDLAAFCPDRAEILEVARNSPCEWVLFDTFDKRSGTLLSHLGKFELARSLAAIKSGGMQAVVAGRLELLSLAELPLELIDMVAVRGAACEGGREGSVRSEQVAGMRDWLTSLT